MLTKRRLTEFLPSLQSKYDSEGFKACRRRAELSVCSIQTERPDARPSTVQRT
jgi:hypothetical protein